MRLWFCVLALVLIIPVLAEPITLRAGDYNVSVDLGIPLQGYIVDPEIDEERQKEIQDPEAETYTIGYCVFSMVDLIPDFAVIEIRAPPFKIPITPNSPTRLIDGILGEVVSFRRVVDYKPIGYKNGFPVYGPGGEVLGETEYGASYVLSDNPYRVVYIDSTFPWPETIMLLDSIHVELSREFKLSKIHSISQYQAEFPELFFKESYIGPTENYSKKETFKS